MATVKGGLFAQYDGGTYTPILGKSPARRYAAKYLSKVKVLRELMHTLNGVVAGSAASVTRKRIKANSEQGGLRTIETVTDVSRVTVAGDVTTIDADVLTYGGINSSEPINLDLNPLGTR